MRQHQRHPHMTEIADSESSLEDRIAATLEGASSGITSNGIAFDVRKKYQMKLKASDVNSVLYKGLTSGKFEIVRKGPSGAPYWKLKHAAMPTISSAIMFTTVSPTCPDPERLIGALVQTLLIEGVTTVTCNTATPNGKIAARLAIESGLICTNSTDTKQSTEATAGADVPAEDVPAEDAPAEDAVENAVTETISRPKKLMPKKQPAKKSVPAKAAKK